MASKATKLTPGRTARVIHWLFPSRRNVGINVAAEVGLALLQLPFGMHVLLGVMIHLATHLVGRRR